MSAKILNESIDLVPATEIHLHPRNPRRGDIELIRLLIRENGGFYGTLVVQTSRRYIIVGNHRYQAGLLEGIEKFPVAFIDVDDATAERILVADNRSSDVAENDPRALAELLVEMEQAGTLAGSGYDAAGLADLLRDLNSDDEQNEGPPPRDEEAEELQKHWKVQRGDIWTAGGHRIMCGDSCLEGDVRKLLGETVPQLMVTDPPYGIDLDLEWRGDAGLNPMGANRPGKVKNDKAADPDWSPAYRLFPGDVAYCWAPGGAQQFLTQRHLEAASFVVRQQIIWRKTIAIISRQAYNWQHESCWYAVRKGATANWLGGHSQTTVWDAPPPNHIMSGGDGDQPHTDHPTQKPLVLWTIPMENHTRPGMAIYDPFLGSGTAVVAAEQLGRICYGVDIEEKWVAVILQRLADMNLDPEKVDE